MCPRHAHPGNELTINLQKPCVFYREPPQSCPITVPQCSSYHRVFLQRLGVDDEKEENGQGTQGDDIDLDFDPVHNVIAQASPCPFNMYNPYSILMQIYSLG